MLPIQHNISLKSYNTFAVDVQADFFCEIHNEQEIFDLISTDVFATQPHIILGGGANILFTKNYNGLVIKVSLLGKKVVKNNNTTVYVKVEAGENWHEIMMRSLEQGYVGGENLVLIPGQVGAAPVGNIGAYGKEAKDIIHEVEGVNIETKEKKVRTNNECKFGYRESIFKNELKNKVIITSVTFIFQKQSSDYIPDIQYNDIQDTIAEQGIDPATISAQEVANIIITLREKKLPDRKKVGTAGSFFKNPIVEKNQFEKLLLKYPQLKGNAIVEGIKLSSGQLIELAGYKGRTEGAVATYDKHALIIVNNGGASGGEIRAFAQTIQKKVLDLFEVSLEPEVIIL
ncbi:MAG: UDP-N-acetylmuramate dehydrogenase [Candidatus Absconditabacterales bacterium]